MHDWSDKDVDWKGIGEAAYYIQTYCRRWGRIYGSAKEKYGTVRFYCIFGELSLHSLLYPGYSYSQFPKWLWVLDIDYISKFLSIFNDAFFVWQKFIYSRAYRNALKKWPHLTGEILCDSDYPEFIEGATRVEGNKTHIIDKHGNVLSTWIKVSSDDQS